MRIGIIIPVGPDEDVGRWRRCLEGIRLAMVFGSGAEYTVAQVVRSEITAGDDMHIPEARNIISQFDGEGVTVSEQLAEGYRLLLDDGCEYVMAFSANDLVCPNIFGDFLRFDGSPLVFYGLVVLTDPKYRPICVWDYMRPQDASFEFLSKKSLIPDSAIIHRDVFDAVEFDGSQKAGVHRIFFMQALQRFDRDRFVLYDNPHMYHVQEEGQLSHQEEWLADSADIWHQWFEEFEGCLNE